VLSLVVTADDLGIDSRRDDGIFEAFERGAITQASLLVGGPSAVSAAARARADGWPMGLHLNLTEGSPTAPHGVGSLVDASGRKLGKHGLRDAAARGAVLLAHVRHETEAQIAAFETLLGCGPLHVDGHQHAHVIPQLVETLATTFARLGVVSTRIPEQPLVWRGADDTHRFFVDVTRVAAEARVVYAQHGVGSTQAFVGLDLMGINSTSAGLCDAVSALRSASSAELMCHPGYAGTGWDDFNRSPAREHELRVLLAQPFAPLVGRNALALTSFADLADRDALWCPR